MSEVSATFLKRPADNVANAADEHAAAARFATYTVRLAALVQSRLAPRYRARLDADDVVASAWRSFLVGVREARWNLESTNLWPLLAMLVTRKLHRQVRRHRRSRRDVDQERAFDLSIVGEEAPSAEDAIVATEAIESALDELDPLDREVVLLRLRGDSPAQIAAATGASERSVSRGFATACEALRERAGLSRRELEHADLRSIVEPVTAEGRGRSTEWTIRDGVPEIRYSDLRLVRMIGHGGIGRVYRAVERSTLRNLAVKFLKKQFWKQAPALQSLAAEVQAISRIDHPGVVRPAGWGRTPSGTPFIASELIEGFTLDAWSRSPESTPHAKLSRLADVAEALAAVHTAGVVHGDVTPMNVMCTPSGRVVLVDFGLSTDRQTLAASKIGATLAFAAPEQVVPALGTVGPWTDVYGFGATAYSVLTGRSLHTGSTRTEITASILNGGMSTMTAGLFQLGLPEVVRLLSQCVAREGSCRSESMLAVATNLRAACV